MKKILKQSVKSNLVKAEDVAIKFLVLKDIMDVFKSLVLLTSIWKMNMELLLS